MPISQYGILGQDAPELDLNHWIDENGEPLQDPIKLSANASQVKIIYCFQDWCPSCHTQGFPVLSQLADHFSEQISTSQLVILVVQTVFEGRQLNTDAKLRENQIKYDLKVPFAQDDQYPRPSAMTDYRTGGTPWFNIINRHDTVIYSDFHIDVAKAVTLINSALSGDRADHLVANPFKAVDDLNGSKYTVQLTQSDVGYIDYQKKGSNVFLNHAEIPANIRGSNYGAILMEAVLEKIESQGFRAVPICSYVNAYFGKFKRWEPLLTG